MDEAAEIVKRLWTEEKISYSGKHYTLTDAVCEPKPVQKPHPPLWYGVVAPENTHWAALERAHMVTLAPTSAARAVIERYDTEWASFGNSPETRPMRGVSRLIVLAKNAAVALRTAERAYRSWLGHMRFLWDQHGIDFPLGLPPAVEPLLDNGFAYAGTASGFRDFLAEQVAGIGADYIACDVAFGDMTFDEAMTTTEIIGREVIPRETKR